MTAPVTSCPKCGKPRTRNPHGRGLVCVPCERARKRSVAKRLAVHRKPDPPESPKVLANESSTDPILATHQENLAGLRAALAQTISYRQTGATIQSELSVQCAAIDTMAEELLEGRGTDQELGQANIRKQSLCAQLEHLHKRQHSSELSLQKRLSGDIRAIVRLESSWNSYLLEAETHKIALLLVDSEREKLGENCHQLALASKSYQSTISSLGEAVMESYAWSRPLDAPKSEKTEFATSHIRDPLYAAPDREEIVKVLLEAASKAIKRWEALLEQVQCLPAFELPSYEEPPPPPPENFAHPDSHTELRKFWLPSDLEHPPWEPKVA